MPDEQLLARLVAAGLPVTIVDGELWLSEDVECCEEHEEQHDLVEERYDSLQERLEPFGLTIHDAYMDHDTVQGKLVPLGPKDVGGPTTEVVKEPEPPKRYWSIAASMEARGYGDTAPREPWEGAVMGDWGDEVKLSQFDPEGKPDTDTNATTMVRTEKLYATRRDALAAYVEAMMSHAQGLRDQGDEADARANAAWCELQELDGRKLCEFREGEQIDITGGMPTEEWVRRQRGGG